MTDEGELGPHEGAPPDEQDVLEQLQPMSMSDDMGDPRFDVAGVALGAVSPEEAAEVRAAAATDTALAAELAAMREVVSELARVEPMVTINRGRSAGIRSRLIARASASHAGRPARQSSPAIGSGVNTAAGAEQRHEAASAQKMKSHTKLSAKSQSTSHATSDTPAHTTAHLTARESRDRTRAAVGFTHQRSWGWLALAASIAFAAAATQLWRVSNERGQVAGALVSRQTTLAEKVSQLEASVAVRDSVITALTGPRTRVIDLASYSSLAPVARMFWDQKTEQWTMYASRLKAPSAGKTYQLWLIAKGNPTPISAGTFTPDASGSVVMHAKYALAAGTLQRIAVTEEPDGGVPAPTGPVVLAGVGR